MLDRRREVSKVSDAEMESQFQKHLADVKFWLARQPSMEVLYVNYNELISDPEKHTQAIADFIDIPVDVEKMRSVPNKGCIATGRTRRDRISQIKGNVNIEVPKSFNSCV